MQSSPAEIARTLVQGLLPATIQAACAPGPLPVRHATDCAGQPLLLVQPQDPFAETLRRGSGEVAVALRVDDLPPVAGAPSHGRAWVSGWTVPLDVAGARCAALEFAEVNPLAELLDVGHGARLYRIEVDAVRLERGGAVISVAPDDFAAADPDPLHPWERDLLLDLHDHHGPELGAYLTRQYGRAAGGARCAPPADALTWPRPVRIDRYGMLIEPTHRTRAGLSPLRWLRMSFPAPVRDRADLARLLHPVLFHPLTCARVTTPPDRPADRR